MYLFVIIISDYILFITEVITNVLLEMEFNLPHEI